MNLCGLLGYWIINTIRYKLWLMNHMRIDLRVRSFSHKQFRSGTTSSNHEAEKEKINTFASTKQIRFLGTA